MTTPNSCVFCTATNRLIDFIPDNSDGCALIILPVVDAWQRHENSFKSELVEITRDRFHEMLNILPPVAWNYNDPSFESFKMSERTTGSITTIFVRIHDRYFAFSDTCTPPHRVCVARVLEKFFSVNAW